MRIARYVLGAAAAISTIMLGACGSDSLFQDHPVGQLNPLSTSQERIRSSSTGEARSSPISWHDAKIAAPSNAFVSAGTGQFVGKSAGFAVADTASGEDGVTLNLLDAPVAQAAKTILGDILKVNYTVSDKVTGSVTLQTTSPVSKAALIDIFESVLKLNGAIILRDTAYYRIEPTVGLAESGRSLGNSGQRPVLGSQTRVLPLRNISASEARKLIEPIAPQGAIIYADNARNIIIAAGTARELNDITNAISVFDVDWLKGMSFAMFPVKTSDPEAIAKELETVFGLDKDGPLRGVVRFVPNKRLGTVLVISSSRSQIEAAKSWIEKLDQLAEDSEEQLFVYKIRNRSATELASLLSRVLSREDNIGAQAASIVAPGLEPAAIATSPSSPQSRQGRAQQFAFGSGAANSDPEIASGGVTSAPSVNAPSVASASNKVVADESNNALLIMASPKEYDRIFRILNRMDVLPTQVLLEAMIAEVTLNDELKFGLKWFFEKNASKFTLSNALNGAVASAFPGFSYFFSATNVQLALDAVSGITKVNVVSAPSLMVLDNRKAVLQVGDQVPIVTQTAQGVTLPDSPIVNSISFRDTGVILSVTPRVNEAGRVVLEVEQEVSNVARTTSSGIDSPTIQQRRIKTTVAVADGEVLTLGGLIQERDNVSKTQIPIIGDVPVLGAAFGSKTDRIDRTELLIFIRPLVVRDSTEAREVTEEFRNRINLQAPTSQRGRDHYHRDAVRILR